MKMHPNGDRTLLLGAKAVKPEIQPATPPPREITLAPSAESALTGFCARYNLPPEIVIAVCAGYFLDADTLDDRLNREGLVNHVRRVIAANRRKGKGAV